MPATARRISSWFGVRIRCSVEVTKSKNEKGVRVEDCFFFFFFRVQFGEGVLVRFCFSFAVGVCLCHSEVLLISFNVVEIECSFHSTLRVTPCFRHEKFDVDVFDFRMS